MAKTPKKEAVTDLPLGVTQTQLNQWKAKHGEVHLIDVDTDNGTVYGYFKKPSLDVMSATAKFADSDPVKSILILYEGCKLKVDAVIDEDDQAKIAAAGLVGRLFKQYSAGIKKL